MPEKLVFEELKNLELKRVIGEYPREGKGVGPTLLVSAGIHGNEPSGIAALKRIFEKLESENAAINGKIIGVAGNFQALQLGVRMIDKDLNRVCTPTNADEIKKGKKLGFHEAQEFAELLQVLEKMEGEENFRELLFMDLHTTSSDTKPYISVNKRAENFAFAKKFPLPVVSGIEKYIPGHFDHYLTLSGNRGFTVEAGQHDSPKSVDYHEAVIWMGMAIGGLVDKEEINQFNGYSEKLGKAADTDGNFEVVFRYAIQPNETFKMKKGFGNFQKIAKGDLLAWSNDSPIYSHLDGLIFMPLYQSQGSDGFFIVKPC